VKIDPTRTLESRAKALGFCARINTCPDSYSPNVNVGALALACFSWADDAPLVVRPASGR